MLDVEKLKQYLLSENETINKMLVELQPYDIYDNSNACKQNYLYGQKAMLRDIAWKMEFDDVYTKLFNE